MVIDFGMSGASIMNMKTEYEQNSILCCDCKGLIRNSVRHWLTSIYELEQDGWLNVGAERGRGRNFCKRSVFEMPNNLILPSYRLLLINLDCVKIRYPNP